LLLTFVAIIILVVTIVYSNYLANELEATEIKNGQLYQRALKELAENDDLDQNVELLSEIISSFPLPNILVNETGDLAGHNWGDKNDTTLSFLAEKIQNYEELGASKLQGPSGYANTIYVFNSPTLTYIRYFPIVQMILISLFVLFAYFLFNASKRAEQSRVWAGMAKETAHQLGTPISAILGWIEHLKMTMEGNEEQQEILGELVRDVDRLELVADRFSKIGSAPALTKVDIYEEMIKCKNYMAKRSPRKVSFNFEEGDQPIFVMINQHLFDWVIENILRNALDAMDGKGIISSSVQLDDQTVVINISDTGKGIPNNKFQSVFKPGFSTKQRGWGLGLSLAKRIIENYHQGKIFVKNSKINEGTTFTIKLPLA
jgi:signal transduction histidine kinase